MKGSGTPMSRGWVPYGKHATRSVLGPRYGKGLRSGSNRSQDGLDTFACRREAVGPRGQGDEDELSGFAGLVASIPTWPQQMVRKNG